MKPTVDQVLQEFDELSLEDQQRVYVTLKERKGNVPVVETNDPEAFKRRTEELLGVPLRDRSYADKEPQRGGSQKIVWKNILISFSPNDYLSSYEEIWRLESILGSDIVRDQLSKSHVLNAEFIENLFTQAPYEFYIDQAERYLFSNYAKLPESKGGPLKPLTALETLQRYGLKRMEESKEKQYIRL
ncbi:hypothetical protein EXU85_04330 [Spirosoma sp. KCTC 42546]|uniref:hypothetical protein n=1 Tax=Spirosoma sp. KCTC 42546 TaxID=2520506 RepID=UPI001158C209|nr:hypothetical protein [Spirosoma sp. KCTC 42546]QDK77857.1 hypothetical protein EXU85_04330 [Spirosoma sp. KCTC 42546]